MAINVLEWVTCPHCGVNFKIAVPNDTFRIHSEDSEDSERGDHIRGRYCDYERSIPCPKCSETVYIYLFIE